MKKNYFPSAFQAFGLWPVGHVAILGSLIRQCMVVGNAGVEHSYLLHDDQKDEKEKKENSQNI